MPPDSLAQLVGRGPAGHADHPALAAHRRHVVVVAQVDQPVREPAPDAGAALVDVLLGADRPDPRVGERHLHRLQQPGLPGRVGVGEDDHLTPGGPDADPEGRALAGVPVADHLQQRAADRRQPGRALGVLDVQDDDHLGRLLHQPGAQAAQQDVRVLAERRHHDRGAGTEVVHDRLGEPGQHRAVDPQRPHHDPGDAEGHELLPAPGPERLGEPPVHR